jgi:CubicO group peptidase (beta-lactamase class C family)
MSALEQPYIDAINAGQIEGVLLEGRTKAGKCYSKALGHRTRPDGTQQALLPSDLSFLASATKLLTTIAALRCCEQGKLSVDVDLSSQLARVSKLGVLVDWDGSTTDKPNFEPLRRPLTLRHLLTHSSGLTYEFTEPKIQRWRSANPVVQGKIGVEARFTTPLAFQPGEGWMYGSSIDWAGFLVERATNMKLEEYFRKYIFEPVGVSDKDISFFPVREGLGDRMPDLNPKDPKGLGLSAAMGMSLHDDVPGECYGGGG